MRTHRFVVGMLWLGCAIVLAGCQAQPNQEGLQKGFQSLDQKEYDQALTAADRYLAEHPSGKGAAEAAYLRGRAIEQRVKASDAQANVDLREAGRMYQQALDLGPSPELEGYIRTSLGNAYYWLDDYTTAESQWTAAYQLLQRDDLKSWVLYRVGLCQQRMGKWAAADLTFAAVQRQFPGSEASRRALEHEGAREFNVQVGAFQSPSGADALVTKLRKAGFPARRIDQPQRKLHLVMVGPLRNYSEAQTMHYRVTRQQYKDAMIVP